MRSILASVPSKYLRSAIITSSHRVEPLQVLDQILVGDGEFARQVRLHVEILIGRFDALRQSGDIAMVAVGAMAMQFELRMPTCLMRVRSRSQSSVVDKSTST